MSQIDPLTFSFTFCYQNYLLRPAAVQTSVAQANYHTFHRVTIFSMLDKLPLKRAWCLMFVAEFSRDEDVELLRELSNGDGTFTEIPLGKLELKDDTVPCLLTGCPSYYSSTSAVN